MGFINAICSLGALSQGSGLEPYLSFPLEKGGKLIRIALRVTDWMAIPLEVQGVAWVDLADEQLEPQMKLKYLYRDRVGSNVSWGFTPIHKIGKPKKDKAKARKEILGNDDDWEHDSKAHLNKIKNKLLLDYERAEIFSPGSVDRIMSELPAQLELSIMSDLDPKSSHIFIFGVADGEHFYYPGEVPAFVSYFKQKLSGSLGAGTTTGKARCAICQKPCQPLVLSKIFKFATPDKVSVLHGLQEKEEPAVFPICQHCFARISSGRDRSQMKLNNNTVLPRINIWTIPEAVGGDGGKLLRSLIASLEESTGGDRPRSIGDKREAGFFTRLAREGKGLVFHFIFWERNNAQELVHLMVEDVPPERLALLERRWGESVGAVFGKVREDLLSVDWAIRSLYKTLSVFAGKSEGDRKVFRDFTLKVIGKMLKGERLPVAAFKQAVVKRAARLVYETNSWNEVSKELLYAQTWVDYMNRLNQEVGV